MPRNPHEQFELFDPERMAREKLEQEQRTREAVPGEAIPPDPGSVICDRSPCGEKWDPKLSEAQIDAAMLLVGTPKLTRRIVNLLEVPVLSKAGKPKRIPGLEAFRRERAKIKYRTIPLYEKTAHAERPGDSSWPLAVSYGLGLDSTAILVGLAQLYRETGDGRFRPSFVTFGDVGAEKPETYAYLEVMNEYLLRNGFPEVTVVSYWQRGEFGTNLTLEQKCLANHTLASISVSFFQKAECSMTWKQVPQNEWFKQCSGLYGPRHNCTSLSLLAVVDPSRIPARAPGRIPAPRGRLSPAERKLREMHGWLVEQKGLSYWRNPESVIGEVTSLAGCSEGSVRAALNKLVKSGHVEKAGKKGREALYRPTQAGVDAAMRGDFMTGAELPSGVRIVKAIGYDVTEEERLSGKSGTFRAADDEDKADYLFWYPLLEWGWDRARCWAEVKREIGKVPPKSSCFFCAAMKPQEVAMLPRNLLKRALLMEQVALLGRNSRSKDAARLKGVGAVWSWTDFALGLEGKLDKPQRGFGQLLPEAEVKEIVGLAKAWIAASPKRGGEADMSQHPLAGEIDAYTHVLGFRHTPHMSWRRWQEGCAPEFARNPRLPYDPLLEGG